MSDILDEEMQIKIIKSFCERTYNDDIKDAKDRVRIACEIYNKDKGKPFSDIIYYTREEQFAETIILCFFGLEIDAVRKYALDWTKQFGVDENTLNAISRFWGTVA